MYDVLLSVHVVAAAAWVGGPLILQDADMRVAATLTGAVSRSVPRGARR
jgi:putative copper export protein